MTAAGRCKYDRKTLFRSYATAAGVAGRHGDDCRVYWCAIGGGYHISSATPEEYERTRARYVPPKERS